MKHMSCPVHGTRPISEFICWGEERPEPPDMCSDETWADYLLRRHHAPHGRTEWWCHTPSRTWFLAMRDTGTDRVSRTWLPGDSQ